MLPYSASLKNVDFRPIIAKAKAAIPPGLRQKLTINVCLEYPPPIGFLFANNCFGKMLLQNKQEEEAICNCAGLEKFFGMSDCKHVITTNPQLFKNVFPILFDLCKKGGKYRTQTRRISPAEISNSIA